MEEIILGKQWWNDMNLMHSPKQTRYFSIPGDNKTLGKKRSTKEGFGGENKAIRWKAHTGRIQLDGLHCGLLGDNFRCDKPLPILLHILRLRSGKPFPPTLVRRRSRPPVRGHRRTGSDRLGLWIRWSACGTCNTYYILRPRCAPRAEGSKSISSAGGKNTPEEICVSELLSDDLSRHCTIDLTRNNNWGLLIFFYFFFRFGSLFGDLEKRNHTDITLQCTL